MGYVTQRMIVLTNKSARITSGMKSRDFILDIYLLLAGLPSGEKGDEKKGKRGQPRKKGTA